MLSAALAKELAFSFPWIPIWLGIQHNIIFLLLLYSHMQIHAGHNDNDDKAMKMSDTVLRKIYLSLYLKGFVWEEVGDRTELQYIDLHSYGHQRCVFLVLQGCSTGGPGAQLSAGFLYRILSPTGLVSKTDFLSSPSYIIVQSPTQYLPITGHQDVSLPLSLEWHVWSSSSGNNCHAVNRSLSSGASVYDCTMGFYLVPYCQPSPPMQFLPITAIGMCHFCCLWNGMFGRVEGQYTTLCLMVLNLFKSLTIKGLFWFEFFIDCRTEMESEWMMNFFMLLVSTIWNAKFIAQISAVNTEALFGRDFFIIFLLKTALHPVLLLSLKPFV